MTQPPAKPPTAINTHIDAAKLATDLEWALKRADRAMEEFRASRTRAAADESYDNYLYWSEKAERLQFTWDSL